MKESTQKIIKLTLIFLCIIFSIFYSKILFDWLITPITKILWIVINLFRSIDQQFYWTILIFVIIILGIFLLPITKTESNIRYKSEINEHEDRKQFWKNIIVSAKKNETDRIFLQENLNRYLTEINQELTTKNEEKIKLIPYKKNYVKSIQNFFLRIKVKILKQSSKSQMFDDFELTVHLSLKKIEALMEKKYGNFRN